MHTEHIFYKNKWFLLASGVLFLLCIDQFSKQYMQMELAGYKTITIIENVLEFRYLENTGASFGIFKGKIDLILLATMALLGYLIWEYAKLKLNRKNAMFALCCCMCVAGGLGNMLDRIAYGYVIDFIYLKLIEFPIFNIADCYIVVSLIGIILLTLQDAKRQKQNSNTSDT